jgi:hypothetical protein
MAARKALSLRAGQLGDLDRIVDITLAATADQALIAYNFPHRVEFPEDNRYYWKVLLRSMFFDPRSAVVVVEADGVVVAWAEWARPARGAPDY